MRILVLTQIVCILISAFALVACVENKSPVAAAGVDQTITSSFNSTIVLSGKASYDPSGDPLSFFWTIEELPAGSEIELTSSENIDIEITLDVPGVYRFGLVVMDGDSFSRIDTVIVRFLPDSTVAIENYPSVVIEHPIVENKDCAQCHTTIEPDFHPAMSGFVYCSGCHFNDAWLPVKQVDHIFLSTTCTDCHQLPPIHSDISEECIFCHNTFSWLNAVDPISVIDPPIPNGFDHNLVIDKSCVECHSINGTETPKPFYHIESTELCEACHETTSWIAKNPIDHSEVLGGCSTCHVDFIEPTPTPLPHIYSTYVCEACHSASAWFPVIVVDHKQVIGTCISCHNGIFAVAKYIDHIPSSPECKACHITTKWKPLNRIDHDQVIGLCDSCHNTPPENHFNKGVISGCADCHLAVDFGWQNASQPLPL